MPKDYYAVLGLAKGASAEDVKKAYRRLSKELHPDKHKGDKAAEARFKEVNEAYEVLSDPQKKQAYDQFGEAGVNGGAGGGFGGFDFSGAGGDAFSDIFESFFGGGRRSAAAREEGGDREVEVLLELRDVVTGAERTFQVKRLRRCETCGGSGAEPGAATVRCGECGGTGQVTRTVQSFFGMIRQSTVCPRCRGAGSVPERPCKRCDGEGRYLSSDPVTVRIPPGIQDGQSVRLRGEGDAGRRGANAGDLFVHVHVREDPRFQRQGADIRSVLAVTAVDAILGTTVDVETVQGTVSLRVPEGTQPGQVLRIKGKGLPVLNGRGSGDHFVRVDVTIPSKLSRAERKLLEEWRGLRG